MTLIPRLLTSSRLLLGGLLGVAACIAYLPVASAESIDDLFGGPPPEPKKAAPLPTQPTPAAVDTIPAPQPAPVAEAPTTPPERTASTENFPTLTGFYQNDLAYTYAGDGHWSRFNNTLDVAGTGNFANGVGWKLGGRVYYDPIYTLTDHYPGAVRRDQGFEASIREAYVDVSAGGLDFRLGRQQIVWGEVVGLFFADVVSARDLRQLVLPDFDMIRIPQWAARAEYFSGDFHAETILIPYLTYDNIGKPGAEFYPFNPPAIPGFQTLIAKEDQPHGIDNTAYGARLSWIKNGWDVSGFYYGTTDPSAAFSRAVTPTTITYQPIHKRIQQLGATLAKDLGPMVLKAETVYTHDKLFNTVDPTDADGLVKQNLLDYIVSLEWSFPQETRVNVQLFQRWFPQHNAGIVPDATESGVSLLLSTQFWNGKLEPRLLVIRSLNRDDLSAQLKLSWKIDGNWQLASGVDIFEGPPTGLFGTFDEKDRVYTEVRYSF